MGALIADLTADISQFGIRPLQSIFIGGGTPSLFSPKEYHILLTELKKMLPFAPDIEITMEANPGTVEQYRFSDYRALGINRLSLGVQSFNPDHLKKLGRIHDEKQAHKAIESARKAGFDNLNIDIMYSLPQQDIHQGLADLQTALSYQPEHLSWYQLTIEPNTLFYKQRPSLPSEDDTFFLEQEGYGLLANAGLSRYEISAFAQTNRQARHNLNYWLFGDYLGIGAGAHGKITSTLGVQRTRKHRQPADYLNETKPFLAQLDSVSKDDLVFEFMLNTTRLEQPIPLELFSQTTDLALSEIIPTLQRAADKKLIDLKPTWWQVTALGRRYTNDLQAMFLPFNS